MATLLSIAPVDGNSSVTQIDVGNSSPKLGGTLNVSAFPNLEEIRCDGNDIAEFTGYAENPNIKVVLAAQNQLSGPIPDITGMTSLEYFWVMVNGFTGSFPDISQNTELRLINVGGNNLTGTLPASIEFPSMFRFNVYANSFTGSIPDCSNTPNLDYLLADGNSLTDFTGGFPTALRRIFLNNNNLTETAVDNVLQAVVDANRTTNMSGCVINLGGSGNSAPSAAGIANKNTLIGRGWSVSTN